MRATPRSSSVSLGGRGVAVCSRRCGFHSRTSCSPRSARVISARRVVPSPVGMSPTKTRRSAVPENDMTRDGPAGSAGTAGASGMPSTRLRKMRAVEIQFRDTADLPSLPAPHSQAGTNALIQADHQKAEHGQRNQHFEKGEAALTPHFGPGAHRLRLTPPTRRCQAGGYREQSTGCGPRPARRSRR